MVYFLTNRNPVFAEKYLALASCAFFSAANGLTISRPCNGVKATLEAVPEVAPRTVDLPPYVWLSCCRVFCSFFDTDTWVFLSTGGPRTFPLVDCPIWPRENPKSS